MKKTSTRQIFAILLTLMLTISMLSACSNTNKNSSSSNSSSSTSSSNSNATTAADSTESTETPEATLPLTTDKITLKMWIPMDGNFATTSGDYNDNEFFKEMELRTGVHIEFMTPASGEETTNFNLMIASGELPDIIVRSNLFTEGFDAAIDDGYFTDLSPYMDTYLADFNKRRSVSDDLMKATTTDSGKIGSVIAIFEEKQGPWMGMQVRKDWLDDCGLDLPVTYADWEEMLTAFKDQKGAYAPLCLGKNGYMLLTQAMSAGYNTMFDFMNVDGSVQYGPISEGWRKYVTTMADWYAKGLIDPDYMTSGIFMVDMEKVTSGQTGAWSSMYTMPSLYEMSSADKNMSITAIAPPMENEGEPVHIRLSDTFLGTPVSISAETENAELCMKWLNYLYTDEGALLANYGLEGQSFEYDENGKPHFNDTITANPDGLSMAQAQAKYTCPPSAMSVYYDWTRELISVPEKDLESYDIWGASEDDYVLPTMLSFTSEESLEKASLYADIETYAIECTNQFITGYKDINTDWDDYVNTIKSMNIDRCIGIYQSALDRYNAR